MNKAPFRTSITIVTTAILLAACGGGGGGGEPQAPPNAAPSASSVSLTDDNGGDTVVGDVLTGTYSYSDPEGNAEGSSTFRWLRDGTAIGGATDSTYVVVPDDVGATIVFEVTPVAATGTRTGNAATSDSIDVVNTPPSADAGADQVLVEGNTAVLSAAASTDPEGAIVSYLWTQTGGPILAIQDPAAVTTSLATVLTDVQLTLTFEVTVTDNFGATSTATTMITIDPSLPPVVDAGIDTETIEREAVSLAGTAVDTDGSVSTLTWTQTAGPAVVLADSDTVSPSFEAPVVADITTLEFELAATDNTNDESSDVVSITVNPNEPPEIHVHFPCDGCRSYGSALTVTGEVTSGPDNAFVTDKDSIAGVAVDAGAGSVAAIVETSGRWIAQNVPIPTDADSVSFNIEADDVLGESSTSIVDLSVEPTLTSFLVAPDPATPSTFYLYETNNPIERLFSIDTATQSITRIYEATTPPGNVTQAGKALVDAIGSRLILNDYNVGIVAFDLSTGAFTVVSDVSIGNGPNIGRPWLMAIDPDDNRLVVYDDTQATLFLVDLTTGDRTVVSDNTGTGSGVLFDDPNSIAVDATNDVAFLHESGEVYLSVDLATGDRATLPEVGSLIGLSFSMDFDSVRSRLAVVNWITPAVYTIDFPSGVRALLSNESTGSGPNPGSPREISVDLLADRYVVNDYSENIGAEDTDQLVSVSPLTGDRSTLFDDGLGFGASLDGTVSVDVDSANDGLFLASELNDNLVRLDFANGERTVISDATTGSGTAFGTIRDIAIDAAGNRVLVVDAELASLLAVDLATGNRSVISGGVIGGGDPFSMPIALEPDYANGRVFILDQSADTIVSVDLSSGQRTTISGSVYPGPDYMAAAGLTLDEANNRLLASSSVSPAAAM